MTSSATSSVVASNAGSLGVAAQAAGGVASAVGAFESTTARRNMLGMDAQIAQWQASQALYSGQVQEEASRLQSGALFGRQRANFAANGVQLGSGSPLDVLASTKYLSNVDAATIHDNAMRAAWGYNSQASIDRYAANQLSPAMSGFSTLLGNAGSVASSWYRYNRAVNGSPGALASSGDLTPSYNFAFPSP